MTSEREPYAFLGNRYSRRDFLSLTGRTAMGASALAGLLAACDGGEPETPTRALRMHHDAAVGPLFEPYVQEFNKRYVPLKLETSYVTQDYLGVTNTQLAGGSVDYDVLFADEGYLERWSQAGWIRDIEGFDGATDLLADMLPGLESNLRDSDGTLVALPYFFGTEIFIYNEDHLGQINAQPPATWEEHLEIARELKSKGISETPYSPFWMKAFFLIWHQIHAEATSDGAGPFFDDSFNPNFSTDPVVAKTLERWQTLYNEGLVPQDAFTTDYGGTVNVYAGGASSMTLRYQPQLKGLKDPEQSQVADVTRNATIPGTTRKSHSFGAFWFMAEATPFPDDAWLLMSYLAGKDKNGDYYVPKNLIAIDLGLGTPYDAVNKDPDVSASWSEWADVDSMVEQISTAVSLGPVVNQPWYAEFAEAVSGLLQEAVLGSKTITDALTEAADLVRSKL